MYGIYGNMDPINIPPMLAYIPYMDPMGTKNIQEIIKCDYVILQYLASNGIGCASLVTHQLWQNFCVSMVNHLDACLLFAQLRYPQS